jgi:hypothetical protein
METGEKYQISLYCLPSNTTHELQPLDEAVFRSFEYHWTDEVMLYWHYHSEISIKEKINSVLGRPSVNSGTKV